MALGDPINRVRGGDWPKTEGMGRPGGDTNHGNTSHAVGRHRIARSCPYHHLTRLADENVPAIVRDCG